MMEGYISETARHFYAGGAGRLTEGSCMFSRY